MKDRIKKIRKELDLTQQKFADKLGVKRNTVGQWECGINAITDQVITSICREFNVNEDWLRTGEGNMFRARNTTNEELALQIGKLLKTDDEFTKNLFLEYLKLPPEMKTLFEDFVHNLAKSK